MAGEVMVCELMFDHVLLLIWGQGNALHDVDGGWVLLFRLKTSTMSLMYSVPRSHVVFVGVIMSEKGVNVGQVRSLGGQDDLRKHQLPFVVYQGDRQGGEGNKIAA